MADYFTKFSFAVPLPDKAAQQYALDLAHEASQVSNGDELSKTFPQTLADARDDWFFDTDPNPTDENGIWLTSADGGVDSVCLFVQHLLQKFNPEGRISFQWSDDCSKPRFDAFGGGAAIITAKEIKSINTSQWLQQNGG